MDGHSDFGLIYLSETQCPSENTENPCQCIAVCSEPIDLYARRSRGYYLQSCCYNKYAIGVYYDSDGVLTVLHPSCCRPN